MVSSVILLALASVAAALQVESPSSSSVWTVGEDQTITWDAVSTDQDTFSVYLSNMVIYPSVSVLLASDVDSSSGSITVDGSKLTAGDSFTINFTNGTETEQIYAQSNQFNITEGSSSTSSSASATATESSSSSTGTKTTTSSPSSTVAMTTVASSATPTTTTTRANSTISGSSSSATASATGSSSASDTSSSVGSSSTQAASGDDDTTTTSGAGRNMVAAGLAAVVAVMAL